MPSYRIAFIAVTAILSVSFFLASADDSAAEGVVATFKNPSGVLTLPDALALTLEQNPDLEAFSWDIRAAEAREIQAGLRPNPELSFEIEDFRFQSGPVTHSNQTGLSSSRSVQEQTIDTPNGPVSIPLARRTFTPEYQRSRESGAESGLSEAEITLRISQLIELGGKRSKRVRLANREREVAAWDYEVARANALTDTAKAFYAVVAAQDRVKLAEELRGLGEQVLNTVIARVDAGKVSPIERSRGEVEYANVKLDVERARRELEIARVQLAAQWGATSASFVNAVGSLDNAYALPSFEALKQRTANLPDISRWMAEIEQRDAAIALERANAKPDLTVTLGLRSTGIGSRSETSTGLSAAGDISYFRNHLAPEDSREETLVLGFSLPLPVFNRNQGRILEAQHLATKAAVQRRSTEVRIESGLIAAYQALDAAHVEVQTLQSEILPKAQEAFDATNEGYRQGKFGLLDVLAAQRALFDARSRLLNAQAAYWQYVANIERLTGQAFLPLSETNAPHEEQP